MKLIFAEKEKLERDDYGSGTSMKNKTAQRLDTLGTGISVRQCVSFFEYPAVLVSLLTHIQ